MQPAESLIRRARGRRHGLLLQRMCLDFWIYKCFLPHVAKSFREKGATLFGAGAPEDRRLVCR